MKEGIEIPYSSSVVRPIPGLGSHHYMSHFYLVPPNFGIYEGYYHIFNKMVGQLSGMQTSTIEYLIVDMQDNAPMKAIPLQALLNFYGMSSEDPYEFLFEFTFYVGNMIILLTPKN